MPSVKDALKAVFQKNGPKVQELMNQFDELKKNIIAKQEVKADYQAELKNGVHNDDMKAVIFNQMRNVQNDIADYSKQVDALIQKAERLGGKEQAAGMRAALEKIHGYEHQKGIKQNAKGL
jgi:hypothetical protein